MRRILLASVALVAIALAAPLAGAQYPEPTPQPPAYETQVPDPADETTDAMAPTVTPQTQEAAPPVAPTPDPSLAQTDPAMTADPTWQAEAAPAPQQAAPEAYAQATPDPYAAPESVTTIDLSDEALMAGMDGVPMTAAEVCEPRSVSLTQGGSRLNTSARRHLINATDHASVCEVQRVVIRSPDGRGEAARATLIAHGVDDTMIEVEQATDNSLGVEMNFAGVATSSEQYAAMFNPVQTAALTPAPAAAETELNQPTSYQPADAPAMTEPTLYEPADDTIEPTAYEPPVEEDTASPIY